MMTRQDRNPTRLFTKVSDVLLFVGGFTLGVVLSNLKEHYPLNPQLASLPISAISSSLPSNIPSQMLMPDVTSAVQNSNPKLENATAAPTASNSNTSQTFASRIRSNNMSKICVTQPNITGGYLEKYLRPPKAFHDMNVSELLWRASMSPRIPEYPIHLVPKVAFMFLTKGPVHLALLWENFFKGHQGLYSIYVHSSPSYDAASHPESPVFHERRIPSQEVEWGKVSLIEAVRRLLANALLDISNQHFVLLSETCIPLYNFSTVYSYLINSTRTFVEVFDDPSSVGRGRYYLSNYTRITVDEWRKGWAWFAIDREVAIESISDRKYFPEFLKCKGLCFYDEHYLPTFVHLKFAARNANRTLTWADWSKGGPHPMEYRSPNVTAALLSSLRSGYGRKCEYNGRSTDVCFLFARKFMPNALDNLLRLAPQIMYFST